MKRMVGIAIPTVMAALAMGSGAAWAQIESCPDVTLDPSVLAPPGIPGFMPHAQAQQCNATYGGCFRMAGGDSDTLAEVVKQSIVASGTCFTYWNTGSDQGESNMLEIGATAYQGIAFMSRNFRQTTLTAHSDWAPMPANLVGFDVGVIAVATKNGDCAGPNLNDGFPTRCQMLCATPAANGVSAVAVLLGGNPAGGRTWSMATTAECADPCRQCMVDYLASQSCESVSTGIEHIYRLDDKSSMQDAFREPLNLMRWCNGKSEGNLNRPGSNLLNEDLDPIRRSCDQAPGQARTRCTYYPTNQTCMAGDPPIVGPYNQPIKCTQGLVVAMSEVDPASCTGLPGNACPDITTSIGYRIQAGVGSIVGLAGPAVAKPNNYLVYISGTSPLFLQRNPTFGTPPFVVNPVETQMCNGTPCRIVEENKLWNWVTDQPAGDGCNMVSIIQNAGLIPRILPCNAIPVVPVAAGFSTPKQNIGAEGEGPQSSSNKYACVADGVVLTSGTCPPLPALSNGFNCNLNQKCWSGACNYYDTTGIWGVCGAPPPLVVASPVTVPATTQTTLTVSGGVGPYTWSLSVNNSGGSITPAGVYTAGPNPGTTDTAMVTDSLGDFATVSVLVTTTVPVPALGLLHVIVVGAMLMMLGIWRRRALRPTNPGPG